MRFEIADRMADRATVGLAAEVYAQRGAKRAWVVAGLLGETPTAEQHACLQRAAAQPLVPTENRPCVAVATLEGVLVNQHLGEADQLQVYRQQHGEFELVETRPRLRPAAVTSVGSNWPKSCTTAERCWFPARNLTDQSARRARHPRGDDGGTDRRGPGGRVCRPARAGPAAARASLRCRCDMGGNGQGCL